ncbi:MAG TPA: NAD(P)-dependent oxidoreductase, partial [Armatimonadota bacterium]|nr:NAD(P)-dependent oxidoreductase [Armatimonadota bacterium]
VSKKLGVQLVSLDELLAQSDYISLHLPKTRDTEGLIGAEQISKMKDGIRIINVARGGIIDEFALAEALKSGKVAGAAVDVYSTEPISQDNPLLKASNIITTPHLGASTTEAQSKVAIDVAEQMVDYFTGKPPRAAVNIPPVSPEVMERIAPYLTLAERMGVFLTQTAEGHFDSIDVCYSGDVAQEETNTITRAVLVGILRPMLSQTVNFVNAPLIAEARDIKVTESRTATFDDFTSLVNIRAKTSKGVREISGTIFGRNEMRIVRVDGYRMDLVPEGTMLFVPHEDKPGIIGQVGTILGNQGINIGGMHVGRDKISKRAVMVLSVDSIVPDEIRQKIMQMSGIESIRQISFDTN